MNKTNNDIQIQKTEIVNELLIIQWSDGSDSVISLKLLRDICPCASCAGEKDAQGNIYKSPALELTEASYKIMNIQLVGYYGLRPIWADGHNTGIYSIEYLLKLEKKEPDK